MSESRWLLASAAGALIVLWFVGSLLKVPDAQHTAPGVDPRYVAVTAPGNPGAQPPTEGHGQADPIDTTVHAWSCNALGCHQDP